MSMSIPLKIKDIRLWIALERYLESVPSVDKGWLLQWKPSRAKLSPQDFPKKDIQTIKTQFAKEFKELDDTRLQWLSRTPLWFWSTAWETLCLKRFKRLKRALYMLTPSQDSEISEWKIQHAREYPVEQLIEVNKGHFALCPFHDDSSPSLYCKNNWMKCFSCNWHGDTIQFIMEREKISFRDAVLKLQ